MLLPCARERTAFPKSTCGCYNGEWHKIVLEGKHPEEYMERTEEAKLKGQSQKAEELSMGQVDSQGKAYF